jgi:hypothetical protein
VRESHVKGVDVNYFLVGLNIASSQLGFSFFSLPKNETKRLENQNSLRSNNMIFGHPPPSYLLTFILGLLEAEQ